MDHQWQWGTGGTCVCVLRAMSETMENGGCRPTAVPEDFLAERGRSIVREMLEAGGREGSDRDHRAGDDGDGGGGVEKEGGERGYSSHNLDIRQVLFLLRKKVSLGPGMPPSLEGPPWRLPTCSHPKAPLLNSVLEMSIEAQAGRIKDSGDFEEFIVSNSSLAIAGLVRQAADSRDVILKTRNLAFGGPSCVDQKIGCSCWAGEGRFAKNVWFTYAIFTTVSRVNRFLPEVKPTSIEAVLSVFVCVITVIPDRRLLLGS